MIPRKINERTHFLMNPYYIKVFCTIFEYIFTLICLHVGPQYCLHLGEHIFCEYVWHIQFVFKGWKIIFHNAASFSTFVRGMIDSKYLKCVIQKHAKDDSSYKLNLSGMYDLKTCKRRQFVTLVAWFLSSISKRGRISNDSNFAESSNWCLENNCWQYLKIISGYNYNYQARVVDLGEKLLGELNETFINLISITYV